MKPPIIGLIFIAATASASASAQIVSPIMPQIPGSSTAGTVTLSGCITGGGVGAGPITMMTPVILPSTVAPGNVASPASPSAVGTTGTIGTFPTGSVMPTDGTTPLSAGPAGYRLTGSDLTSWVGRRVQVIGSMAPVTPEIVPAPTAGGFQEFHVQTVVPLTGPCPQR